MVIKSHDEVALLRDIKETFRNLAQKYMKINIRKVHFGVEEGQFLGYQITREGIAPNQAKIQEFLDSKLPHNIKGVQEINGRLTTRGRFIARSIEKDVPLFHTLKGCVDKNQFKWTVENDNGLECLKEALHQLPVMEVPLPREILQVYLAASDEAISSVLIVERNKKTVADTFRK